jgi:hypothetical protein
MPDTKGSALAAVTTLSADDLLYVVDAPGGTAASKKITVAHAGPALLAAAGVTAGVAELNVLDGIPETLTATELGYVDGVTSAIQTQLNAKLASTATGIGAHSIWVPASAMISRITNGPASGSVESSTNKVMQKTLNFDASTAEYAQFTIRMPKSWDESTVTAQFLWSAAATGDVVWGLQGLARSDDDDIDTAFGTAQTVTDGVTATTDIMQSSATSAITIGGTPAEADLVVFQVYRDAASGPDTLAADARLIGLILFYTTNAGTDA